MNPCNFGDFFQMTLDLSNTSNLLAGFEVFWATQQTLPFLVFRCCRGVRSFVALVVWLQCFFVPRWASNLMQTYGDFERFPLYIISYDIAWSLGWKCIQRTWSENFPAGTFEEEAEHEFYTSRSRQTVGGTQRWFPNPGSSKVKISAKWVDFRQGI